jgi:hypothetical protein
MVLFSAKHCKPFFASCGNTHTFCILKTGCHDIAEILLKKALKHQKSNKKSIKLHSIQARHIDNLGCFRLSILRIIKNRQNYTFYRKDMKYVMKYRIGDRLV